jgi:hypothetical protein
MASDGRGVELKQVKKTPTPVIESTVDRRLNKSSLNCFYPGVKRFYKLGQFF